MSGRNVYDVSSEKREIIQWRDAKRRQLRELYLKDSGHPTKSLLFDTGIYRYAAAKTSMEMFFVPTLITYVSKIGLVVGLVAGLAYTIKTSKDAQEHRYRTGQVSYADRWTKFI